MSGKADDRAGRGRPRYELLEAALSGRMDDLTPGQVERLEGLLERDSEAVRRVAQSVPAPGAEAPQVQEPTGAQWDAMFERVEDALTARGAERGPAAWAGRGRWRLVHAASMLVATAACVVLAFLWNVTPQSGGEEDWPLEVGGDVVIRELRVSSDATPLVVYSGDATMILVFEDQANGQQEGA